MDFFIGSDLSRNFHRELFGESIEIEEREELTLSRDPTDLTTGRHIDFTTFLFFDSNRRVDYYNAANLCSMFYPLFHYVTDSAFVKPK